MLSLPVVTLQAARGPDAWKERPGVDYSTNIFLVWWPCPGKIHRVNYLDACHDVSAVVVRQTKGPSPPAKGALGSLLLFPSAQTHGARREKGEATEMCWLGRKR